MSYRSPDGHRIDNVVKQINDLKKEANKREQQKKEMADVVEQGNLVEIKGRRPIKMTEAFIRPALDGKRLPGEVEIHQNGIRYQSLGSQKVGRYDPILDVAISFIPPLQISYLATSSICSSNLATTNCSS